MNTADFLKQVYVLGKEIKVLQNAKDKAYERATSCGMRLNEVRTSGSDYRKDGKLSAYLTFSMELDERILYLMSMQKKALTLINTVTNCYQRMLLINRYINSMTWEEIADEMGYSVNYAKRTLHTKALSSIKTSI